MHHWLKTYVKNNPVINMKSELVYLSYDSLSTLILNGD